MSTWMWVSTGWVISGVSILVWGLWTLRGAPDTSRPRRMGFPIRMHAPHGSVERTSRETEAA